MICGEEQVRSALFAQDAHRRRFVRSQQCLSPLVHPSFCLETSDDDCAVANSAKFLGDVH